MIISITHHHYFRVFNMVFNMLKPFLTPEVRDGIVFHSGDLASLRSRLSTNALEILTNTLEILTNKDVGDLGPAAHSVIHY